MSAGERVKAYFASNTPPRLGVAVSGGSDSLALLSLLQEWLGQDGPRLWAVTVDHGLRPEAAEEAAQVGRLCRSWDIPHATLPWAWDGRGNLPSEARRARYRLMADWAKTLGLVDIAIAHTRDDQAETFLMRLAREAGLDGLAAMVPAWVQHGVTFHRPALDCTRAGLREHLVARGLTWAEDPSNDDQTYERARTRDVLAALTPLGLSAETLANVSRHLRAAQEVVEAETRRVARAVGALDAGDVLLDRDAYAALPDEIARRLLQEALMFVSGAEYPPRAAALARVRQGLIAGQGATLSGCRLLVETAHLRIAREAQAVMGCICAPGAPWDNRWCLTGPEDAEKNVEIRALGEAGLIHCPDWRTTGRPAAVLHASPAAWHGETLLAAPLAGFSNGWRAKLLSTARRDFAAVLLD